MRTFARIFRSVLVLLAAALFFAATQDANAQTPEQKAAAAAQDGGAEEKLTPEEERAAAEAAESFFRRLEERPDIGPLLDEMFVSDFAERLHKKAVSSESLHFVERGAAAQATRDEVRRYFVAFHNFMLLTSLYAFDAGVIKRAPGPGGDDDADDVKFQELFPPEVYELLKSDPLLGRLVLEDEEDEGGQGGGAAGGPRDDGAEFIHTVEHLRAFTATLERAEGLLRGRLTKEQTARAFKEMRAAVKDRDSAISRPRLTVLREEFYGHPAGARIVCVEVIPFHVDLVRVEGRYKVLAMNLAGG